MEQGVISLTKVAAERAWLEYADIAKQAIDDPELAADPQHWFRMGQAHQKFLSAFLRGGE